MFILTCRICASSKLVESPNLFYLSEIPQKDERLQGNPSIFMNDANKKPSVQLFRKCD